MNNKKDASQGEESLPNSSDQPDFSDWPDFSDCPTFENGIALEDWQVIGGIGKYIGQQIAAIG